MLIWNLVVSLSSLLKFNVREEHFKAVTYFVCLQIYLCFSPLEQLLDSFHPCYLNISSVCMCNMLMNLFLLIWLQCECLIFRQRSLFGLENFHSFHYLFMGKKKKPFKLCKSAYECFVKNISIPSIFSCYSCSISSFLHFF